MNNMKKSKLCECGCGEIVKPGNRFIHGHNGRNDKIRAQKISESCKGLNIWSKSKPRSEKTKKKISKNAESNPNYGMKGKHHSNKTIKKIKIARAKQIIVHSEETKEKLRKPHLTYNIKSLDDYRKIRRLNRVKQLEKNFGKGWANYNPKACEVFKSFDEENNTKGRYAMYGNGEYVISELGYSLDYINFEKKLIREWDEPRHYNKNGDLKEYDVIRQQEIQEFFPDFKFERIKEMR